MEVVNSEETRSEESIDAEILKTRCPRFIASGNIGMLDPLLIAAEGYVFVDLSHSHLCKLPMVVVLLVGTFYLLNVKYTSGVSNVYAFLEASLLKRPQQAKKRISVQ